MSNTTTQNAALPDIKLPPDLLPADGRFGSGPSKVRTEALTALAAIAPRYLGTSHRQAGVKLMVEKVRAGLTDLFSLPDGYEVALGNGGAAFFWDAAVFGLIDRRSQHLSFGAFSASFAGIVDAAPHLNGPEIIEAPFGTRPEPRPGPAVDTYAFTHNETSTGVAMEILRPEQANPTALVVVDATSAAGGLPVDPTQFDAYYFAPQKCFGSDGGLWLALLSPAAAERIERLAEGRWIPNALSLSVALAQSRLNQTYNTPALATLFLLANQLEWLNQHGGLEWAVSRSQASATVVYEWAEASSYARPFVADPADRSTVVATVDLADQIDGKLVCKVLRANGIVDTEPYRALGRNQLRIAFYPNVDPEDVAVLTRAVDHVVAALS